MHAYNKSTPEKKQKKTKTNAINMSKQTLFSISPWTAISPPLTLSAHSQPLLSLSARGSPLRLTRASKVKELSGREKSNIPWMREHDSLALKEGSSCQTPLAERLTLRSVSFTLKSHKNTQIAGDVKKYSLTLLWLFN